MYNNLPKLDKNIFKGISKIHVLKNRYYMPLFNIYVSLTSQKLEVIIANTLQGGRLNLLSYLFLRPQCKYILVDSLHGDAYLRIFNKFSWDRLNNFFAYKISQYHINMSNGLIYHSREIIKKICNYTNKPIMFMPFSFFKDRNNETSRSKKPNFYSNKITFTITGGIEKNRKDYTYFFDAIKILGEKNPSVLEKIDIVFGGTIKKKDNIFGRSILNGAKKINSKYGDIIKFYTQLYIPEEEYRKNIEEADILLNLINLKYYKFGGFSSGLSESITYSIPNIYPKGYKILDELRSSTLFFHNAESLARIIEKIVNDKVFFSKLKNEALNNSRKFSIGIYSDELLKFINNT